MLHFIYTYSEKTRRGHCYKTVRIYEVKQNTPLFVGEMTDAFVDEFQLVMQAMDAFKLLPARAFEKNANTGGYKHYYRASLIEAKIATISRIV